MEGQGYQDEFVKTHLIIALPGQKGKMKKNTAQTRHSCTLFDALSIFV
jgi:hypothetical protein